MSAKRFGLASTSIEPQPDFSATVDEKGRVTARQSFKVLQGAWASVAANFYQGAALSTFDANAEPMFGWLPLNSFSIATERGGYRIVSCDFVGFYEGEATYTPPDQPQITYTRNATLIERSILEHPKYLDECTGGQPELKGIVDGTHALLPLEVGSDFSVLKIATNERINLTDPTWKKWAIWFDKGLKTWNAPAMEWTVTRVLNRKLDSTDLLKIGKKQIPIGAPYTSPGADWILVGATESIVNGVNSTSLTWREEFLGDTEWKVIYN